jgi:L-alanine-DL-glutamate epimerase-like enolase superfamily enzyme
VKITEISTIAVAEPGGRRYVILKLSTDEGISGYGEAPAGANPETAVAAISRETAWLRGQDPARLLFLDQELRRAGASAASRAAANIATLDILARAVKAPLY